MSAFRLASLLRLRSAQQDQAAAELASEAAARLAASRHASSHREALAGHRLTADGGPTAWMASVAARAALTATHREAVTVVALAEERVARAEVAWHDARRTTKALEHLEDRHRAVTQAEEARVERLALDEHTSAVSGRRPGNAEAPHSTEEKS